MQLVPKNWASFQHYKDRAPPWVKLHKELLDDRTFQRLPVASRALAPMLWLLASESKDGTFDGSVEELAFRLRCAEQEIEDGLTPLIDKGFFLNASKPLAKRKQVAVPEAETEAERETEKSTSPAKLPTVPVQSVVDLYHEVLPDLPVVRLKTKDRERAIAKMWRWVLTSVRTDGERRAENPEQAIAWLRSYFERARDNDFLMGRTQKAGEHANWRCDLDFLLTDKGMKHVIEKTA